MRRSGVRLSNALERAVWHNYAAALMAIGLTPPPPLALSLATRTTPLRQQEETPGRPLPRETEGEHGKSESASKRENGETLGAAFSSPQAMALLAPNRNPSVLMAQPGLLRLRGSHLAEQIAAATAQRGAYILSHILHSHRETPSEEIVAPKKTFWAFRQLFEGKATTDRQRTKSTTKPTAKPTKLDEAMQGAQVDSASASTDSADTAAKVAIRSHATAAADANTKAEKGQAAAATAARLALQAWAVAAAGGSAAETVALTRGALRCALSSGSAPLRAAAACEHGRAVARLAARRKRPSIPLLEEVGSARSQADEADSNAATPNRVMPADAADVDSAEAAFWLAKAATDPAADESVRAAALVALADLPWHGLGHHLTGVGLSLTASLCGDLRSVLPPRPLTLSLAFAEPREATAADEAAAGVLPPHYGAARGSLASLACAPALLHACHRVMLHNSAPAAQSLVRVHGDLILSMAAALQVVPPLPGDMAPSLAGVAGPAQWRRWLAWSESGLSSAAGQEASLFTQPGEQTKPSPYGPLSRGGGQSGTSPGETSTASRERGSMALDPARFRHFALEGVRPTVGATCWSPDSGGGALLVAHLGAPLLSSELTWRCHLGLLAHCTADPAMAPVAIAAADAALNALVAGRCEVRRGRAEVVLATLRAALGRTGLALPADEDYADMPGARREDAAAWEEAMTAHIAHRVYDIVGDEADESLP